MVNEHCMTNGNGTCNSKAVDRVDHISLVDSATAGHTLCLPDSNSDR